ncbi:hypothetical protein ACJX0J_038940, partial [Zea mays]
MIFIKARKKAKTNSPTFESILLMLKIRGPLTMLATQTLVLKINSRGFHFLRDSFVSLLL